MCLDRESIGQSRGVVGRYSVAAPKQQAIDNRCTHIHTRARQWRLLSASRQDWLRQYPTKAAPPHANIGMYIKRQCSTAHMQRQKGRPYTHTQPTHQCLSLCCSYTQTIEYSIVRTHTYYYTTGIIRYMMYCATPHYRSTLLNREIVLYCTTTITTQYSTFISVYYWCRYLLCKGAHRRVYDFRAPNLG